MSQSYSVTIHQPDSVGTVFNMEAHPHEGDRFAVSHSRWDLKGRGNTSYPSFMSEEEAVNYITEQMRLVLTIPGPKVLQGDWDRFLLESLNLVVESFEVPRVDNSVLTVSEVLKAFHHCHVSVVVNFASFLILTHRLPK